MLPVVGAELSMPKPTAVNEIFVFVAYTTELLIPVIALDPVVVPVLVPGLVPGLVPLLLPLAPPLVNIGISSESVWPQTEQILCLVPVEVRVGCVIIVHAPHW